MNRRPWGRGWPLARLAPLLLVAACCAFGPAAAEPGVAVSVPVNDIGDRPLELPAFWFAAGADRQPRPALVLLHGCGGPYDRGQRLSQRMLDYAALARAEGWHALVVDSLSPRGETELCTQRSGSRKVTQAQRRRDALAALQWLARRPEVDASRLALVGWSHGGGTVLAASNRLHPDVERATVKPRALVAFYPGCTTELKRGYGAVAPLLLLLGADDDWTPSAPCVELAAAASSAARIEYRVYEGAHHGFDGEAPLRLRRDVPNGVQPGAGVHVGGQPQARAASRAALRAFLQREFAAGSGNGARPSP
jgi:dienelactone hydrolase